MGGWGGKGGGGKGRGESCGGGERWASESFLEIHTPAPGETLAQIPSTCDFDWWMEGAGWGWRCDNVGDRQGAVPPTVQHNPQEEEAPLHLAALARAGWFKPFNSGAGPPFNSLSPREYLRGYYG